MPTKIVIAGIVVKDGKILVARRSPGENLAGKWEFPGGKLELGETPEFCLKRELKEELGIDGTTGPHICDSVFNYDFGSIMLRAYAFQWESGKIRLSVHDELVWVSPAALLELDLAPADVAIAKIVMEKMKNV